MPGILTIRLFKGQDFPQLDPNLRLLRVKGQEKDLVDPYCVVRFARHKEETDCVKNNHDPVWNTEIRFPAIVSHSMYFLISTYHSLLPFKFWLAL